jgi:hypothetical protein
MAVDAVVPGLLVLVLWSGIGGRCEGMFENI